MQDKERFGARQERQPTEEDVTHLAQALGIIHDAFLKPGNEGDEPTIMFVSQFLAEPPKTGNRVSKFIERIKNTLHGR